MIGFVKINRFEHFVCNFSFSCMSAQERNLPMRLIIGYFAFVCVLVIGLAGVGSQANAAEGDAAAGAKEAQLAQSGA